MQTSYLINATLSVKSLKIIFLQPTIFVPNTSTNFYGSSTIEFILWKLVF